MTPADFKEVPIYLPLIAVINILQLGSVIPTIP